MSVTPEPTHTALVELYSGLVDEIRGSPARSTPTSGTATYDGVLVLLHDTPDALLGLAQLEADYEGGSIALSANRFAQSNGTMLDGYVRGDGIVTGTDSFSITLTGHLRSANATAEVTADLSLFLFGTDSQYVEGYGSALVSGFEPGDASYVGVVRASP